MKITTRILVACLPGIVAGALFAASTGDRAIGKTNANESALSKAKSLLGKLALSFEPNRGQTDPRVQFLSRGPGYTVFFTNDETVFSLKDTKTSNAVVRMRFVGGTNSASATPLEPLPGTSNYLKGNDPSKWQTGVHEYTKLRYENVYPGIDVVYQGDQQQLRYDFIVKPGASAGAIEMAFQGADKVAVTKDGDLALTIGGKTLVTKKPFTYQEDGGAKKEVASHFVVKDNRVTFELAKYDTAKDVVIDPTVVFISYLGGLLNDSVNGVAIVNPAQTANSIPSYYVVTGTTDSINFPNTAGVNNQLLTGNNDVFVTEISYNATTIKWSTYLGGNSQDAGQAVAVDTTSTGCVTVGTTVNGGCPVVVGQTYSNNFPTVPFANSSLNGTNDAFVAKFSSVGQLIFSSYIGGVTNDNATGVAVNNGVAAGSIAALAGGVVCTGTASAATGCGDIYVGGYTDSASFPYPPGIACPVTCTNQGGTANHGFPTQSSDAFIVKMSGIGGTITSASLLSTLYGGFGEEFARGIAYNPVSKMVYLAGDTTTAAQNFIAPHNVNLPGLTNQTALTGLPGLGPSARGGFVAAFDGASLVQTFGSYVAVSPNTGTTCGISGGTNQNTNCNQGVESITSIAVEGGAAAGVCSGISCATPANQAPTSSVLCSAAGVANPATPCIAPAYGNAGHMYITGVTTSNVPTSSIAVQVPGYACASGLIATDGTTTGIKTGQTLAAACTTALVTQAPFNNNYASNVNCPYPITLPLVPNATCNLASFVSILDSALLIQPNTLASNATASPAPLAGVTGIGNQIEYWAYYGSVHVTVTTNSFPAPAGYSVGNSSAQSNAIAIDTNPTTSSSVYSLGYYQQMYITGSTQYTNTIGTFPNQLPVTSTATGPGAALIPTSNPSTIFTPYNVGTTGGGGVGGFTPIGTKALNQIDGFVARFNPNGLASFPYGGSVNTGGGTNTPALNPCTPVTFACDRSTLIHTPQFNYGEFLYASTPTSTLASTSSIPSNTAFTPDGSAGNTVGNAIAVDVTRSVIIGGATNNSQTTGPIQGASTFSCPLKGGYNANVACLFTTTNTLTLASTTAPTPSGAANNGGTDGFVATLFFNDILTDAPAIASANPFLEPGAPNNTNPGAGGANTTYIETTPPPFGPTFDFAVSDPSTQTQTAQIVFTGQIAGQIAQGQTPWFIPLDARFPGTPTTNNGLPGSGIVYYLPCYGPGSNPYPAPGGPYSPQTCLIPASYPSLQQAATGWPSANPASTATNGQGWLVVSQDINPGVVRMTLDRRAAAGLLEGTYVAQYLVSTLDSQHNTQWPPCGSYSENQPFQTSVQACANQATPLPADNVSILITVRLVVHPSLFLSRNAGIVTGITSALSTPNNPVGVSGLSGPNPGPLGYAGLNQEQGTTGVPMWLWWDTVATAPSNIGLSGSNLVANNVNAGPPACVITNTYGARLYNTSALGTLSGEGANGSGGTVTLPCLAGPYQLPAVLTGPPSPFGGQTGTGAVMGAAAYSGNGPGDFSGGPALNIAPNLTFLYDSGTVQFPSLAVAEGLVTTRPDCPLGITASCAFNSDYQGFADPVTQRNDATVHSYYIADPGPIFNEGPASLSVAAVNCTNFSNPAVGNWLSVGIPGSTTAYTPICTTQTVNGVNGTLAVGTVAAPFNYPLTPVFSPDPAVLPVAGVGPGGIGWNSSNTVQLDFKVTPFSNRPQANGIPTGLYSAQVFVWATRVKNSVPGYCLGASMGADPSASGTNALCGAISGSSTNGATDLNPHPEVLVQSGQMFTVTLYVFDTTQIVQITPNSCPSAGFVSGAPVTQFVTVANSENIDTGNGVVAAVTSTVALPTSGIVAGVPSSSVTTGTAILPTTGPVGTGSDSITVQVGAMNPVNISLGGLSTQLVLVALNQFLIPTLPPSVTFTAALNATNHLVLTATGPTPASVVVSFTYNTAASQTELGLPGTAVSVAGDSFTVQVGSGTVWPIYVGGNTAAQILAQLNSPPVTNITASLNYANKIVLAALTNSLTIGPSTLPTAAGLIDLGLTAGATGAGPATVYPQFGPNADALVVFSLLPFQTTGLPITQPCSSNNSVSCPPGTGTNVTIPLPAGVTVTAQTLAQYNACQLPTGMYSGAVITGSSVPGIGTLQLTGAQSQTVFVPSPNGANTAATIYACRPTIAPAWLDSTVYPGNSLTAFAGAPEPYSSGNGALADPVPSTAAQTCSMTTITSPSATKVGVFRNGNSFLLDSNGNEQYDAGIDRFISTFIPPGGAKAGDIAVSGDWTGDTHYKVGIYRPSTGQWWLDANNDGLFDTGDFAYTFGGIAGDIPVTGDWTNIGKSCIGIFRQGFSWLLDLNCNGTFDNTPTDAFFPFGGLTNDVPITGVWVAGQPTRVGVVRAYAPGGVVGPCTSTNASGCPFYWVYDSGNPNAGNAAANHQPASGAYAFGGLFGDVFVTGDWNANGIYEAGVYRQGFWMLDVSGSHANGQTFFGFGGVAGDQPITGKW